ncbi:MAG TPA: IPT/TIG domain-containing protein [Mycobacteriales bacterium]|nr:IPT/TIG domain-containing protein [Mycobacteriales bacterium]
MSALTRSRLLTLRAVSAIVVAAALCVAGSSAVSAATGVAPGTVTNVAASVSGDQATVSWQAPATGTVARYAVQAHLLGYSPGIWADSGTRIVSGTSIVWGALPLNHAVYFTIVAIGTDASDGTSGAAGTYATSPAVTPTNASCPSTATGYCVVVNTAQSLGPETRPGAGLLHGAVAPGNKWVGALHLNYWRIAATDATEYADVSSVVSPQNVIELLSDGWLAHTTSGGYAADPWSNWTAYTSYIASIVTAAEKAGQNPIWEIQNEPENYPYSPAQRPTRALVEQEYLKAYQAIKTVDPNARVIGPSIDWVYEYPSAPVYIDMKTFIPFAAANGMKLYAIAWHENGIIPAQNPLAYSEMPQAIENEAEEVRELIAENPGIGSPKIFVDENTSGSGSAIPGFTAGYFAAEDQAGVDEANRSCWHSCTANLGGLLNADGNPNPNYWAMADYGSMMGTRVDSEVSDLNLSSLAVTDTSGTTRVLLGRHQTCSQPTTGSGYCSGPSTLAPAVPTTVQVALSSSAPAAAVTVQEIPNSLADMTTAPATTTQAVPIVNGLVSVSIPSFGDGEAYFLTVTPILPPTITSILPATGSTGGGTSVTINGSSFTAASVVQFGTGTPAAKFTVTSDSQLVAVAPAHAAGPVNVSVTNPSGTTSVSASATFTYVAPPTVTSVSPTTGPIAGGTSVTITGTGFTGATAVHFGTVAASSVTVNSATKITVTAPAAAAGAVDVTVTNAGGTSATGSSDKFTYVAPPTVTSISPTTATTAGGTSVTITGTGFTGATAVHFATTATSSVKVNSATSITVTSPAHAAGVVDVTVTTPTGTSAIGTTDHFTYTSPPPARH